MENSRQLGIFRRTKPASVLLSLLIVVALLFPTHSYFIEEMRFWLVVPAIVTALGMLSIATFLLLREAARRGLRWAKLRVDKRKGTVRARFALRWATALQFLASLTSYWR